MKNTFTALIYKEDELYVSKCPEIGTTSQGSSIEESLANLKEATEVYFEEFPVQSINHNRPIVATFEANIA